ncbi:hypothetical protein B0H10DRAFT_2219196 [Mycena sp. CBHHK59/15]|nr:hypothetical protein B0H10DRAFT_2219196 [Mycena sp. CBHHK59/15]
MAATADWDPPVQSTSSRLAPIPRTVVPVSDDWEDDEEVDEPQNTEDNQRIWENANSQAPMPSLIVSSSTHTASAPPAAAFQPKMRILKRPTNTTPVSLQPQAVAGETLKEREARYQAARYRIFGGEGDGASSPEDKQGGRMSPAAAGVAVVRNPRGPGSDAQSPAPKGFRARSCNAPPSPNPPRDSEVISEDKLS